VREVEARRLAPQRAGDLEILLQLGNFTLARRAGRDVAGDRGAQRFIGVTGRVLFQINDVGAIHHARL
jgi:hypothetical protein